MLDNKLVLSVLAEVSRGKSTLVNALVFQDNILENKNGETTAQNFVISYNQSADISAQQELVKKHNVLDLTNDNEKLLHHKNKLFQNVVILDTPGFNSTNEIHMQPKIDKALSISDIVLLVIDVQKGVTQEEIAQVKNMAQKGIKEIVVVVNKKDKLENIDDVSSHTAKIKQLVSQHISIFEDIFLVSAKSALVGYVLNDQEKVQQSGMIDLQVALQNIIQQKIILLQYTKRQKEQYNENFFILEKAIKKFSIKVKILKERDYINLKKDIDSFYYYDEYPTTFLGFFNHEKFLDKLQEYQKILQKNRKINKFLKKIDEDVEELLNSARELKKTYKQFSDQEIKDKLHIHYLKVSEFIKILEEIQVYAKEGFIDIDKIVSPLEEFCFNEMQKGWADSQESKALPKLKKIRAYNVGYVKNVRKKVKVITDKAKELEYEV